MIRLRRAFTISEMLIALAIIALLIGTCFGVLGPARERTRREVCSSNLRQVSQALHMYIDDYQGVAPVVGEPLNYARLGLPVHESVGVLFRDYVKSRKVALCPSYHGDLPLTRWLTTYDWGPDDDPPFEPVVQRWSSKVNARGSDAVVASCRYHNAVWEPQNEPRWEVKTIVLLRLSGEVQVKKVTLQERSSDW